jgi:hypothetical protein
MHPLIAEFSSMRFYDGKLKTSPAADGLRIHEQGVGRALRKEINRAVRFIDVAGMDQSRGTSRVNEKEAEEAVRVVKVSKGG